MKKEMLVRRSMHCLVALAPLYFLLPNDLPVIGLHRWVLLIVFLVSIGLFDAWRRHKGLTFLGLRPHERKGIASYAWAAAGITLVLWVFPQDIATASLVGMAFSDPLAGELRVKYGNRPWPVAVTVLFYFALALFIMALWGDRSFVEAALLAVLGTIVAIPSELLKIRHVDDDFTMLVLPALVMSCVAAVLGDTAWLENF